MAEPNRPRYRGKKAAAQDSLNALLKHHIRRSADGRKVIAHATIKDRSLFFDKMIRDLHALGYFLREVRNLKPKHVRVLMRHWEAQGLSASTLQKRFSHLNTLCTWIGKRGMLGDARDTLADPARYQRVYEAQTDHSWTGQGVDPAVVIERVAQADPQVALVLNLQFAFGLRIQEASMLRPAQDHQGEVLRVVAGTKGGRPRTVPIETDAQHAVLAEAHRQASRTGRSMIPPEYDLKQWLAHCYYVLRRCGVSRREGIVSHGARHQYANDRFEELTGEASPVRGGTGAERADRDHRAARLEVSARLGHARERITAAYYGSSTRRGTSPRDNPALVVARQHLDTALRPRIARAVNGKDRVSAATVATRRKHLHQMLADLDAAGVPLATPDDLAERHVDTLVSIWREHRQIGAATLAKRGQLLVQLCRWLDRPELAHYAARQLQAPPGRSAPPSTLPAPADLAERLARIRVHDERIAVHIELVRLLGLSHRQTTWLQPHRADRQTYLEVLWGNPDACIYRFSVTTTEQRGAVDTAQQLVGDPEGTIRPVGVSARQWLRRVYDTLRTIGGFGVPGGPSLRDLKAAGANPPERLTREAWLAATGRVPPPPAGYR